MAVFVEIIHKNFDCIGNNSKIKLDLDKDQCIKRYIDSWNNVENNSNIAKLFRKIKEDGGLENDKIKVMMNNATVIGNGKKRINGIIC
jgi:hypothetical protein